MRKITLIWACLLTSFFSFSFLKGTDSVWATDKTVGTINEELTKTQTFTLDNGLTVLINEMPSSQSLAVYAYVKTGSATEGKYLGMGISHFVEHMLFKGTEKRGVSAISKEVKSLGGEINASTSYDYTIYTIELPAGNFDKGLDLIADMIMHSRFDPQELEKERAVIFGEMRLYKDNPDHRLSDLVFKSVFRQHPYHHPIIGYEPLFAKITHDDILDYYHSTYIPNNIILSIAGNVRASEIFPKIKEAFKDFQYRPYLLRNLPAEPPQLASQTVEEEYPTDLTRMSMAYQGVSVLDNDMVAMDVLGMILGEGESSRLYLNVYKKKELVYGIGASNFTPFDRGIFEIESQLDLKNVDATISAVKEEIAAIQNKGVDLKELEKVKRQVLSSYVFSHQTPGDVAYNSAMNEAFLGDPDFSQKYIELVRALTSQQIQQAAQKYFIDKNLTVVIIKPSQQNQNPQNIFAAKKTSAIEKIVLNNGLVLLLREDHTFPLVEMNVVLNGGTRRETTANNGISELTSRLWIKGTKSKSAEQIAQQTESRGANLDSFSGRNSFGIKLSLLPDNWDFGIDLLEDFVKSPSFDSKEFLKIKEQMQAAIHARDDNIMAVTSKALRETLFLNHPFRLEPLGTLESIGKITRDEAANWWQHFTKPNNMVISVFGDIKKDEVLNALKSKFGGLKKEELSLEKFKEEPPAETREKLLHQDKEQAVVMIGFQGPSIYDQDRYAMEVIASILGSSLNGRLFLKIRDELGRSYTLGGGFNPGLDLGIETFYVSTTDEHVEKVKELLIDQIKDLQINDVTDEELNSTKTYLKGSFTMSLETNANLSFVSSLDELYGLGYKNFESYGQAVGRVSKADIKRLAKKYLDTTQAAIVITRPSAQFLKTRASQNTENLPPSLSEPVGLIH